MEGNLSKHLSWREFTATQHRQFLEENENPPQEVIDRALRFAEEVFEPARLKVGPLYISSGYRCPTLNAAIGGAGKSAHMFGAAVDCYPMRMGLKEAYIKIAESDIPFDQIIYEYGRWIHLGGVRGNYAPRHERFMIFKPGEYLFFDADDSRVK